MPYFLLFKLLAIGMYYLPVFPGHKTTKDWPIKLCMFIVMREIVSDSFIDSAMAHRYKLKEKHAVLLRCTLLLQQQLMEDSVLKWMNEKTLLEFSSIVTFTSHLWHNRKV